jgi:type I restriction enzyme S subunit
MLNYDGGEIKNLHYGLIHSGLPTLVDVSKDSLPFVNEASTPKKYTLCKEGDVAFADASEDTNEVGKVVEFLNTNGENIISGLHTIHGRDKSDMTVTGFKGYAFSSMPFHHQIRRIAQGTKIYSISTKTFDEVYIGVPTKDEQAKIARLLQLLDERISTQNKIIDNLQSLIKGLIQRLSQEGLANGSWHRIMLSEILTERNELNAAYHPVHSVSVSTGVINQMEYLGRSFAAKDTAHYHVVYNGDLVYTKSPTGNQPFGIVKQSHCLSPAAVSPLYGVYQPCSFEIGNYLHYYFLNPLNTNNYLSPLIQKGAKNTINISNQRFLENRVPLPIDKMEIQLVSDSLSALDKKISLEYDVLTTLEHQKKFLLNNMFI